MTIGAILVDRQPSIRPLVAIDLPSAADVELRP
jgi:hypothetical protein